MSDIDDHKVEAEWVFQVKFITRLITGYKQRKYYRAIE